TRKVGWRIHRMPGGDCPGAAGGPQLRTAPRLVSAQPKLDRRLSMTAAKRSLQIRENITFAHRQWVVQRVAWVGIAALLVLALLGAFGKGPLSHATAGAGPLQIE